MLKRIWFIHSSSNCSPKVHLLRLMIHFLAEFYRYNDPDLKKPLSMAEALMITESSWLYPV